MAIEKVNEDIDLEIEPNSSVEISGPLSEGDALMLDDGSAIVNPMEDTSPQGAFNANLAELIPDDELVLIKNIASGSIIKIMTITGLVIKEIHLDSNESQFLWNGENEKGERVGSSIYIVSAYHPSEQNLVSKIAVISK